jgi:hypothetical protein
MAQTTGAISGAAAKVEYSLNAAGTSGTWVDFSGYAQSVEISGGDALTGQQMTLDGDNAIVTAGNKTNPYTITFNVVYTETDAQPFDAIFDRYQGAAKTIAVRWSPAGGTGGQQQYATTNTAGTAAVLVPIASCVPPGVDATSGDPLMFSFSVITPDILKSAIAT